MCVFVTDQSTNLSNTLLEQYDIKLINTDKCADGQILYSLDKYANEGHDIIYLSSNDSYDKIVSFSKRVLNIHCYKKIVVVNVESGIIGKNNLTLRMVLSKDIKATIEKYKVQAEFICNNEMFFCLNNVTYNQIQY